MPDNFKLFAITVIGLFFSVSVSADEAGTGKTNVLNQKPYSSNQFPEHTIVVETARHGRGTFTSYPTYQHRHRPVKYPKSRAYNYHRPSAHARVYSPSRPTVSYYYSTPIVDGGYVQIQSNHGIYNNRAHTPDHNRHQSTYYPSHSVKPGNRFSFYQQHRAQPYYNHHQSRHFSQDRVPQSRPQCLGRNCGK